MVVGVNIKDNEDTQPGVWTNPFKNHREMQKWAGPALIFCPKPQGSCLFLLMLAEQREGAKTSTAATQLLLRNLLWFVFLCRSETSAGSRLQLPAPDSYSQECQVNVASRPEEDEMFLTPRAPTHPSPEPLNRTGINLCRQYIKTLRTRFSLENHLCMHSFD